MSVFPNTPFDPSLHSLSEVEGQEALHGLNHRFLSLTKQQPLPIMSFVPNLQTADPAPLHELESQLINQQADIEAWFRKAFRQTQAPFYASVDLRNAGYKLAPVDTNLFPAGFNNLHEDLRPLAIHAAQMALEHTCPDADGVILIPENHDRNPFYFRHLKALTSILQVAGYPVKIMSIDEQVTQTRFIHFDDDQQLHIYTADDRPHNRQMDLEIHPFTRHDDYCHIDDFSPCAIILNNDLSAGIPDKLKNLSQTLLPPLELGWSQRKKSHHFALYNQIVTDFCAAHDLDQWMLFPMSRTVQIDFKARTGEAELAQAVDELLQDIQAQYDSRGITQTPYVVIKSDSGTYGMSVMTVKSKDEVIQLNRKQRQKLATGKEGKQVDQLLLQEGVYTFETWKNAVAEPVIYMMDHFIVGGFYRVHTGKTATDNLNSPGMHFEPLSFEDSCQLPNCQLGVDAAPNRFYAYGVVARLALLAAAHEYQQVTQGQAYAL